MFRYKKSVALSYERQGYIYFKCLCYRKLSRRDQKRITDLCHRAGGEYASALFEFVTTTKGATGICMEHHISRSTLERVVRRFYNSWPRYL